MMDGLKIKARQAIKNEFIPGDQQVSWEERLPFTNQNYNNQTWAETAYDIENYDESGVNDVK